LTQKIHYLWTAAKMEIKPGTTSHWVLFLSPTEQLITSQEELCAVGL